MHWFIVNYVYFFNTEDTKKQSCTEIFVLCRVTRHLPFLPGWCLTSRNNRSFFLIVNIKLHLGFRLVRHQPGRRRDICIPLRSPRLSGYFINTKPQRVQSYLQQQFTVTLSRALFLLWIY